MKNLWKVFRLGLGCFSIFEIIGAIWIWFFRYGTLESFAISSIHYWLGISVWIFIAVLCFSNQIRFMLKSNWVKIVRNI